MLLFIGGPEIIVVLLFIVMFFGSKKIPEIYEKKLEELYEEFMRGLVRRYLSLWKSFFSNSLTRDLEGQIARWNCYLLIYHQDCSFTF